MKNFGQDIAFLHNNFYICVGSELKPQHPSFEKKGEISYD